METTLDKKHIAKIFALYIGQRVLMRKPQANDLADPHAYILACVGCDNCSGYFSLDDRPAPPSPMYPVTSFLLRLKPVSKILREDAIEIWKLLSPNSSGTPIAIWESGSVVEGYTLKTADLTFDFPQVSLERADVCKYLTDRGYAVPLFIAPAHEYNGKTAIELGIAVPTKE